MAIGAIEWLRQQGKAVPQDVSVIGFDDQVVASYVTPKLTTMSFPVYDMARSCAEMAVQEIYHKQPPTGLQFTPALVVRQSVSSPA
jgi:LacI family transcriptional regulator